VLHIWTAYSWRDACTAWHFVLSELVTGKQGRIAVIGLGQSRLVPGAKSIPKTILMPHGGGKEEFEEFVILSIQVS
jgi:hypothetical protein